jgi:hypothetical protein
MDITWSHKIDEILNIGYPLKLIGIKNWALSKKDAINAIKELADLQVPIVGGDVYIMENGVLQHNYDSWYCNPIIDELSDDFLARSINKAKTFIEQYNIEKDNLIYFALVPMP